MEITSQKDHFNYKEQTETKCCDDPCIDIRGGNSVCLNCGLVFDMHLVENERRAYNREELEKKRQTEPKWRDFGSRTVLASNKIDYRGNSLNAEKKSLFLRLSKIQNSLITGIERNFWEARPKLKQLVSKLNLPEYINEMAWIIYSRAAKKKLTMGRSMDGFIAASLYIAIRVHDFPRVLEEISDSAMINRKVIIRTLSLLLREVLPELKITYKPITTRQLVYKFGNELGFSMVIQQKALRLLLNSTKIGLTSIGKDPKGIAASMLYLAAKNTKEKQTQTAIAKAAKITEVTLRTRIKEIKDRNILDLTSN
ncbi:MAG: transcription initiation factor IIB family protein [Promethearchaeota archaeon]